MRKGRIFRTAYELIGVGGVKRRVREKRVTFSQIIRCRLNQILSDDNFRHHYEITSDERKNADFIRLMDG